MQIITISRQDGSLGNEIAEKLSQRLGMQLILRSKVISEWMPEVADKYELHLLEESPKSYLNICKEGISFKEYIEKKLVEFTETTPSIIVGLGAQIIFNDNPNAIKVRIIASENVRTERIKSKYGFGDAEAKLLIQQTDKRHKKYISTLYGIEWSEDLDYDMILNTDRLSIEQCVEMIAFYSETKNSLHFTNTFGYEKVKTKKNKDIDKEVVFKHPAEEEFANILDMYGIEWEYEPKTFPVEWDVEGNVKKALSPDFYLVKFDTYIEITTMDQKYVTTKNKKVKTLRKLYPDINVNIVYKKDFHSLLERFGFNSVDEVDKFNKSENEKNILEQE